MAFCAKCGTQLAAGAAACSACGAPTGAGAPAAPQAPARYVPPINAQQAAGFLSSLFDLSFSNFITTKLIKVLFVICLVLAVFGALAVILAGFARGAVEGIFALVILAPLLFLFYVILARVQMEVLIVIFRSCEYLEEIAKQGRR
jgi:Domain of unknown function (DUF4282)/zinc-ribbon domain